MKPEAIKSAFKHYQEDTGRNDLISDIGMMNGQVVRLADLPGEQRERSRETLNAQLKKTRPEVPIKPGTAISEYIISDTKTPAVGEAESGQTTGAVKTEDAEVKAILKQYKDDYAPQFKNINETLETQIILFEGNLLCVSKTKRSMRKDLGFSTFTTIFTRDEWIFDEVKKSLKIDSRDFFMSTVEAHQFEKFCTEQKLPMARPKRMTYANITNSVTDNLIKDKISSHDSKDFMKAYLTTTDNGKSTVRCADVLGMEVYEVTVTGGWKDREPEDHGLKKFFDVTAHIRTKNTKPL
ncbi:hypothetical protein [Endozoicomonas sp.]|uniref:hypothetical protein n=1 Tax=Endozoicomonas sp. TaxID=1892382 RepID=UPI00383B8E6A